MTSFRKVWIFDQLNRSTGCHFSWFLFQPLRFYFGFIVFGYRKLSQMFRVLQSIKVFLMYIFLVPQVLPNVCVRTESLCCITELKRLLFYVHFPNKQQCVPEGSACSVPGGAGWRCCVCCAWHNLSGIDKSKHSPLSAALIVHARTSGSC